MSKSHRLFLLLCGALFFSSLETSASTVVSDLLSFFSRPTRSCEAALDLGAYSKEVHRDGQAQKFFRIDESELQALLRYRKFDEFLDKNTTKTWYLSIYPDERVRSAVLRVERQIMWVNSKFHTEADLVKFLGERASPLSEQEAETYRAQIQKTLKELREKPNTSMSGQFGRSSNLVIKALCLKHDFFNARACKEALEKIIGWMDPKTKYGSFFTLIDEFEEILLNPDPRIQEALRRASSVAYAAVKSNAFAKSTVFEDLFDAFTAQGFSKKESLDYTWKILGLYGTRGADLGNTVRLLAGIPTLEKVPPLSGYLSILFNCASILDIRGLEAGRPYTYPRNVLTHIENGKPYHFWMAAYLARKAAIEGGNVHASIIASWLTELGYQIQRPLISDVDGLLRENAFSNLSQKTRFDLSYGAAGAVFGGHSVEDVFLGTLNIDQGVRELMQNARNLKPLTAEQADAYAHRWMGVRSYLRWMRMIHPTKAIDYFLAAVK